MQTLIWEEAFNQLEKKEFPAQDGAASIASSTRSQGPSPRPSHLADAKPEPVSGVVSRQSHAFLKEFPEPRRDQSACVQILLVEDNPGDARLTREVFAEGKVANEIHVVTDGVEAIRYLRREGPYASARRPDLILLDLNLPRKDGREVLAEIKSDPDLKAIPVIVLTTSAAHQDVDRTYMLHANSFITKPVDLDQFIAVVRSIEDFWLKIVRLPQERS